MKANEKAKIIEQFLSWKPPAVTTHDIRHLNPVFREYAETVIQRLKTRFSEYSRKTGEGFVYRFAYRTRETQIELMRQGRSKTLYSMHRLGLALDFYYIVNHRVVDSNEFYITLAEICEELGLEWGGRWKSFPDKPHVQFPISREIKYLLFKIFHNE